jgi:hypothetical protein
VECRLFFSFGTSYIFSAFMVILCMEILCVSLFCVVSVFLH